jgi:hypothetical protein
MKRWFAASVGSAALVACGIVHGYWTDRWATPVEVKQAAQRLDAIPLELGEWEGEALEVKPGDAGAGVAGCIRRRYVNRQTGAAISLFLVCGRPGPVSIHTPDVCYGASGFLVNTRSRYESGSGDSMWKADAVRSNATEETRLDGRGGSACAVRPPSAAVQAVRRAGAERRGRTQSQRTVRGVLSNVDARAEASFIRPSLELRIPD